MLIIATTFGDAWRTYSALIRILASYAPLHESVFWRQPGCRPGGYTALCVWTAELGDSREMGLHQKRNKTVLKCLHSSPFTLATESKLFWISC